MKKAYSKCCGVEVDYSTLLDDSAWSDPLDIPIPPPQCPKCKKMPCNTMSEEEYINARENCPLRNN